MNQSSQTRTISIDAPRQVVFDFVADAHNLPRWAPGFARAVRPDGEHWLIDTGEGEGRIILRASAEQGTIDLLAAAAPEIGACMRVMPNGSGSEFSFTIFFAVGTTTEAEATQMMVIEEELQTVRDLCTR